MPGWIYRHFKIKLDSLERKFFVINGESIEVNMYGEGLIDDEKVAILVESKSRFHENDVKKFYDEV
ncbi:MAG: hypothetical protein ACP5HX_11220, partial [Thermoproteota archaeon]